MHRGLQHSNSCLGPQTSRGHVYQNLKNPVSAEPFFYLYAFFWVTVLGFCQMLKYM